MQAVREDMDEPENALMGMHGYCTQEMVNLLITGGRGLLSDWSHAGPGPAHRRRGLD